MAKPTYAARNVERAHWWLAKAIDTIAEADVLIPSGQTRSGAYNRLYYATHHIAVSLLRLLGNNADSHSAIKNQFGKLWVIDRGFPAAYSELLNSLYGDREKADYGEYVPTYRRDIDRRRREVGHFLRRASREIPTVSTAHILAMLVEENPLIRDFSFDIYCPKSYFHHTRFSVWVPKGRISDRCLSSSAEFIRSGSSGLRCERSSRVCFRIKQPCKSICRTSPTHA